MYKRIVAGTDLSNTARVATDRAAWLAERMGAELVLVHAGSRGPDQLAALGEGYGAETVVTPGNPAEVLLDETERLGADLLVVGSVGMSGPRRFMAGSVPNKISHHATTDLLIVKTDPPASLDGYGRVLVGTDGSPTATRAVDVVCELSAGLGISPVIVCAYEPPSERELDQLRADPNDPIAQWSPARVVRETPDEFRWRIAAASQAQDVIERAEQRSRQRGVRAETRAVRGHPAHVLVSLAEDEDFDLIAVGSVGMTGARRFMLGNVPNRVSHHAPTDLLIVHTA